MIFDTVDYEFMKLIAFCRYMPTGLQRRYDTPMFKRRVISNLQEHGLIKTQSDKLSYKLTKKGRKCLAEMGFEFPDDARVNLKKASYKRKLKNAQWNVLLHLAGIDIYFKQARELTDMNVGYMSSLTLRSDKNMKVLAGTKFLGILKIADTAVIPYYIENENTWVFPRYERETYLSQVETIKGVKDIQLILIGESLEELWNYIHLQCQCDNLTNGMKRFVNALEELGSEYSLVPYGRDGVLQMRVTTIYRYRERIAKAIGCDTRCIPELSECDGLIDDVPYIIAIDFNVKRIIRALKQIERKNKSVVPSICCMPFQKSTMFKLLKSYKAQKTVVMTIDKSNIYSIFPEIENDMLKRQPFVLRGGEYLEVVERKITNDEIENIED